MRDPHLPTCTFRCDIGPQAKLAHAPVTTHSLHSALTSLHISRTEISSYTVSCITHGGKHVRNRLFNKSENV